jgi:hypothetical protein
MSDSNFDDGLDTVSLSNYAFEEVDQNEHSLAADPGPPLRSRPRLNFSQSTVGSLVGSDFGIIPGATHRPLPLPPRAPSRMSDSTLRPSLNHSTAHRFSHKRYPDTFGSPHISPEIIISLSVEQLQLHPAYRQLQQRYMSVCEALAKCVVGACVGDEPRRHSSRQSTVVPNMDGLYFLIYSLDFC